MIQKARNLLIIFTRPPKLGKVKTRLANDVGEQAALDIYNFLLQHTFSISRELQVEKMVYYAGEIPEIDIWDNSVYKKKLQQGKDLGERMHRAFEEGFSLGFRNIILIGSDLYDLTHCDLEKAFSQLEKHEYVIGPAQDGGYYLIGMKQPNAEVFSNKIWGTSSVFQETLKDLRGKKISYLEYRNDIDVYSDIENIKEFQQFLQPKKI